MGEGLKRGELGIFTAIVFAIGNMVGAGVFVLSGLVIDTAGPSAVLSYIICGILVTFSGLSYAVLASIYPEDGGGYLFTKRLLGPLPGFIAGWAMYISLTIAGAFVLLGFGIYANLLFGTSWDPRLFALGGLVAISLLNMRGISEAGKLETGLVVAKVAILSVLVAAGFVHINSSAFVPFFPAGTGGMLAGISMVFFAYIGFQVVALMGGEIKESSRNVPLAILAAIGIVALIYTGVIIALLSAHLPAYGETSVFEAGKIFFGSIGASVIALGALFSTLSSANANVIGASRITMEMASERQIAAGFARLVHGQPANSILFGTILAGVLIIYGNLDFVVSLTNVTTLVTMALVNASAFILIRKTHLVPPEKTYFRIPLGVLIPFLGCVSCIAMLATLNAGVIGIGCLVLIAGLLLYFLEDSPEGERIRNQIDTRLGRIIR